MKFTKMQGAGNDYIYVNCLEERVDNPQEVAPVLSDRHFGIGGDGLILLLPSASADFKMEIYNADGSQAQMCGNGIRCAARLAFDLGFCQSEHIRVETLSGIRTVELHRKDGIVQSVTVNMGKPEFCPAMVPVLAEGSDFLEQEVEAGGKRFLVSAVSMGNPHAVIYVEHTDDFPVAHYGPLLERADIFPERTNVEFIELLAEDQIKMRVWERGSGETMACGTGACASLAVSAFLHKTKNEADVHLRGGKLHIVWDRDSGNIFMTGPAEYVFKGEADIKALMARQKG